MDLYKLVKENELMIGKCIKGLVHISHKASTIANRWNRIIYSWYTLNKKYNIDTIFTVDAESIIPYKYTARGLYIQEIPFQQTLFIHCESGAVAIIIIDLREDSPTYRVYNRITLEARDQNMDAVYIPKGCAYGFVTLEDNTILKIKTDNYFNKDYEKRINLMDPYYNICVPYPEKSSPPIPISELIAQNKIKISAEDRQAPWTHEVIKNQPIFSKEEQEDIKCG